MKALFIHNSKTNSLNEYFSYFSEKMYLFLISVTQEHFDYLKK